MKNSIKLALAAYGLVGSISFNPNAEMEYLEDDSLFAKTTSQLVHGWEWGVSSAHADTEVICCGWLPPGWNDNPGSGGGGGGGGGGGDNTSSNDSPEDNDPDYDEACVKEVGDVVELCKSTYADYNSGINTLCTTLAFGGTITGIATATLCATGTDILVRKANTWCTEQGIKKMNKDC